MKVSQMAVEISAFPSQGTWDPTKPELYTPPEATVDIWLEWWLPAGYFGGPKVLNLQDSRILVGHRFSPGLNAIDMPRSLADTSQDNPFAAPLPRVPDDDSAEVYCYWANQLLHAGGDNVTPSRH